MYGGTVGAVNFSPASNMRLVAQAIEQGGGNPGTMVGGLTAFEGLSLWLNPKSIATGRIGRACRRAPCCGGWWRTGRRR
jgi:hypothetical protein